MAENALFSQGLFDTANRAEDRALAATGMGTELGGLINAITQGKLGTLANLGQWEQGRQDDFSRMAYEDFERNKLGWIPLLLQAAASQGSGSPGQIYTVPQPGKPSTLEQWGPIIGGLLGAFG
jgi:hypothetical protein